MIAIIFLELLFDVYSDFGGTRGIACGYERWSQKCLF